MKIHEKNIEKSINLNIIGTANITKACHEKNIKLIYFPTNYIYQEKKEIISKRIQFYQLIIMLGQN